MARGKRGGKRVPRNPAPVSGVGAASARTDGGPAKPPVVASGQGYGVRGATESLASSSPMYGEGGAGPSAPPAPTVPQNPPRTIADAQTMRPGPQLPGDTLPDDVDPKDVLRAVYQAYPSPWIASLLGDDY